MSRNSRPFGFLEETHVARLACWPQNGVVLPAHFASGFCRAIRRLSGTWGVWLWCTELLCLAHTARTCDYSLPISLDVLGCHLLQFVPSVHSQPNPSLQLRPRRACTCNCIHLFCSVYSFCKHSDLRGLPSSSVTLSLARPLIS